MSTTELLLILVASIMLLSELMHIVLDYKQRKQHTTDMVKSNVVHNMLTYNELFTLLDVIIVSEVTNFVAITNISNKDTTSKSVSLQDNILELSNKIYTDGIARTMLDQLEYYVTTKFIMEYITRSVRNNLVSSSMPIIKKK